MILMDSEKLTVRHIYDDHPINEGHILKIIAFPNYLIQSFMHRQILRSQMLSNRACLKFWSFQNTITMNIYLNVRLVIFGIGKHVFGSNTPEIMPSQGNTSIN